MYLRVIGGLAHREHMIARRRPEKCDLDHPWAESA